MTLRDEAMGVVEQIVRNAKRIPNRHGETGGWHLVIMPHQMDVLERAIEEGEADGRDAN